MEIRQLLEARNERRIRRGEPAIDIEQELARLTTIAPAIDPALREEIRQLVVARNHRRVRAGKPRSTSRLRSSARSRGLASRDRLVGL